MRQVDEEGWIRWVGSQAAASPWVSGIAAAGGFVFVIGGLYVALFTGEALTASILIGLIGLLFFSIALLWYERSQFYRLIQKLESQLDQGSGPIGEHAARALDNNHSLS